MKVTYRPHHFLVATYGDPYRKALEEAGHEIVREDGDVLFTDGDWPWEPWQSQCDQHERVILFPHSAGIASGGCGTRPRHPRTAGQFVPSSGYAAIAELAGDIPTVVCGWPWFTPAEFKPSEEIRRIFYTPAHAMNDNGADWYAPGIVDAWRGVGRELLIRYPDAMARRDESLVVHSMGETLDSIRWNDLTVTQSSTVAALAVAAGKPCIMFAPVPAFFIDFAGPGDIAYPPDEIAARVYSLARYPYGLDDIDEALRWEAADWRERWIGGPFDPDLFVKAFDSFAGL